ncbi:MAG: helix-turn-helix domain-containing protein, partial [Lachnospiraceae bacterium]|nr:helix-turn-helix domain-containing protein [Lachnospiraceae bacterium]
MRYSYNYKRKAVELYRQGLWPDTPDGLNTKDFRKMIRRWVKIEESCGPNALRHKSQNKECIKNVACSAGINNCQLYQWVCKYKIYGYNGLILKKGRKPRNPDMRKVGTRKPPKPNESEYEELVRLRAENEYMKAEI